MSDKPDTTESPLPKAAAEGKTGSKSEDPGGKKGFRLVIALFVTVVAIIGGVVANNLQLLELPWPKQAAVPEKVEQAKPAAPAVPARPAQPVRIEQPSATSEEIKNLLTAIEGLNRELAGMSQAQSALRESLNKQQQMNLQVRLRWISDPASRLPQIKLAWEEISLLTSLSDAQRTQAEQMHILARDSERKLQQWQDSLHKWADSLATPRQQNIIPEAGHPWLDWIFGQFRLYRAPSEESRQQARLRQKLLTAASQRNLEAWPAEGDWQQLRAELLLQAKSGAGTDQTGSVDLGLPDNFDSIRADIDMLQQTAKQWLEQSS